MSHVKRGFYMNITRHSFKDGSRKVWVCDACRKEIKHAVCFEDNGKEYTFCSRCYYDVAENGLPKYLQPTNTRKEDRNAVVDEREDILTGFRKWFREWKPTFPGSEPESVLMAKGYNLCLHEMDWKIEEFLALKEGKETK